MPGSANASLVFLTAVGSLFWLAGCERAGPAEGAGGSVTSSLPGSSHEGKWKAVSAVLAGTPFPDEVTGSILLNLTGDQYEVSVGGTSDRGSCLVDLRTSPHRMTITGTEGPNAGKTFLAVFDFEGPDRMRVCYVLNASGFPVGFESTAENGAYLVVYARSK